MVSQTTNKQWLLLIKPVTLWTSVSHRQLYSIELKAIGDSMWSVGSIFNVFHTVTVCECTLKTLVSVYVHSENNSTLYYVIAIDHSPGHTASVVGVVARLPWVSLWLPLLLLWRHPTKLHPDEESHSVGLPTKHETAWPIHTKPQGMEDVRIATISVAYETLYQIRSKVFVWKKTKEKKLQNGHLSVIIIGDCMGF